MERLVWSCVGLALSVPLWYALGWVVNRWHFGHPIKTKLVGVSFDGRQDIIKKYARRNSPLYLIREPTNSHDPKAVAVYLVNPFLKIGYLDKDLVRSPVFKHYMSSSGKILAVTGVNQPLRGVNIEFRPS